MQLVVRKQKKDRKNVVFYLKNNSMYCCFDVNRCYLKEKRLFYVEINGLRISNKLYCHSLSMRQKNNIECHEHYFRNINFVSGICNTLSTFYCVINKLMEK